MEDASVTSRNPADARRHGSNARRDERENPYATLQVADSVPVADRRPSFKVLLWLWPFAVLMNVPVPWWIGWDMTSQSVLWIGMPFGILFWLFTGWWLIRHVPRLMAALMCGSVCVALSQFWPMAHLWIGMLACGISDLLLGDPTGMHFDSLRAVIFVTTLTGLGLIVLSCLIGTLLFAVFRSWSSATDPNK